MDKFDLDILRVLNAKGDTGYNQLFKEQGIKDKPKYAESIKELVGKQRLSLSVNQEGISLLNSQPSEATDSSSSVRNQRIMNQSAKK
ncbi:MAG: hypothetical protein H3Z50_00520 [archaeon]|nr:hypothetical protein [archaeon]MCP8305695.1 hypothetical protein [archaeon]